MLVADVALVAAALFTGAALYASFSDPPKNEREVRAQLLPVLDRIALLTALSIVGALSGIVAYFITDRLLFLLGAVLLLIPDRVATVHAYMFMKRRGVPGVLRTVWGTLAITFFLFAEHL